MIVGTTVTVGTGKGVGDVVGEAVGLIVGTGDGSTVTYTEGVASPLPSNSHW